MAVDDSFGMTALMWACVNCDVAVREFYRYSRHSFSPTTMLIVFLCSDCQGVVGRGTVRQRNVATKSAAQAIKVWYDARHVCSSGVTVTQRSIR
jgi:hypothetical protein